MKWNRVSHICLNGISMLGVSTDLLTSGCTVEPLYRLHPLRTQLAVSYTDLGVPNSEVDLYTALCGGAADSVLIREVALIQSVIYIEFPLYYI